MAKDEYRKWRILLARSLRVRYHDSENRKRTLGWIHENIGRYLLGVNDETFNNYCNKAKNLHIHGELPIHIEAIADICEKFVKTASDLENGIKRPSEVIDPECQPVVRVYKRRMAERLRHKPQTRARAVKRIR